MLAHNTDCLAPVCKKAPTLMVKARIVRSHSITHAHTHAQGRQEVRNPETAQPERGFLRSLVDSSFRKAGLLSKFPCQRGSNLFWDQDPNPPSLQITKLTPNGLHAFFGSLKPISLLRQTPLIRAPNSSRSTRSWQKKGKPQPPQNPY